jgi:FMN reductase
MTTIAVVSAGLSVPSSTRMLADRLAAATLTALGPAASVTHVELRGYARDLADNLLTGFPSGDLKRAVDTVCAADGLIAVTPVFAASYSGLFKTFFDVLDREALAGMPVLIGATAGTARHSLVLDHAMRPLFSYLRAPVAPTAVFAAAEDWAGGELADRIGRAGEEFAALVRHAPRPAAKEEFVPFRELLAGR